MKFLYVIIVFLAGVAVASIFWSVRLRGCQLEVVATDLGRLEEEAVVSEHILGYFDNPDVQTKQHLLLISSNAIMCFPTNVNLWDQRYPYLLIKRRYQAKSERIQNFWCERDARAATNSAA